MAFFQCTPKIHDVKHFITSLCHIWTMGRTLVLIQAVVLLSIAFHAGATDPPSQRTLQNVFWMHVQKTSSWLGNFLLLWGCSTVRNEQRLKNRLEADQMLYSGIAKNMTALRCETSFFTGAFGFGYHVPFTALHNTSTITLFRNPYNRVISSFLYGKGIHQIMFPLGFPNRAKVKFNLRDKIKKSPFPVLTYVQLPGIANCQTKMLLGKECGEVTAVSEEEMAEALRRLREDVSFVGLTEESEASARLFLAMFRFPQGVTHAKELVVDMDKKEYAENVNLLVQSVGQAPRLNKGHTSELNTELRDVLRQHGWRDVPDETLYTEAVRLFYERCKVYQIPTKYSEALLLGVMH